MDSKFIYHHKHSSPLKGSMWRGLLVSTFVVIQYGVGWMTVIVAGTRRKLRNADGKHVVEIISYDLNVSSRV
jgi:hypothetical protein